MATVVPRRAVESLDDATIDHQDTPLAEHSGVYLTNLEAEGTSPAHRANVRRCLNRIAADCRFVRLKELRLHSP
jgi:hypothetical protein